MKAIVRLTLIALLLGATQSIYTQNRPAHSSNLPALEDTKVNWIINPYENKVFIEDKGQFDREDQLENTDVLYGVENMGYRIFFRSNGLTYRFDEQIEVAKNESSEMMAALHTEEEDKCIKKKIHSVHMEWLNANPNPEIKVWDTVSAVYNFAQGDNPDDAIYNCTGYRHMKYVDLYPGIDVEYEFHHETGIKYTLIIHPGADPNVVKMKYTGQSNLFQDENGNIQLVTALGNIIDHAPKTFYQSNKSIIESSFEVSNNVVCFSLEDYDDSQTIIIDPWTVNSGFSSVNKAWDVRPDGVGNVYVFGNNNSPYQLKKYSAGGVLQWSLNTPYIQYPGDLAVDNAGNSYVAVSLTASVTKVTTAGTIVYTTNLNVTREYWAITVNCDGSRVVVGDSYPGGYISDINPNTGVRFNTTPVSNWDGRDIRGICTAPNGNFILITTSYGAGESLISVTPAFTVDYLVALFHNPPYNATPLYGSQFIHGYNGVGAGNDYIYTNSGGTLYKRDINTGALVTSIAIPGGADNQNSGVDVDGCGNVYVGSQNAVLKYDSNLTLLSTINTNAVYDVTYGFAGEILACGNAFVASLALNACLQTTLNLDTIVINETCGQCDGQATVIVNGGTSPYTYNWSNGQTTQTATGLCAGTYTVTVNDAGCLIDIITAIVTSGGGGPILTATTVDEVCGGCNGSATVTATGNTPFTYLWSSGGTNATESGLCAGTYTVTVTDNNGCSSVQQVTVINVGGPYTLTTNFTNPLCNGDCNGDATVTATGGNTPYTYSWSNSQTNQTATGLCSGTYTVTVTDNNGCTEVITVTLTDPLVLNANISGFNNVLCNGGNTGDATVNATGGTPGYTYAWSSGGNAATETGLSAGTYTVTVTDNNGCTQTAQVTITEPPAIVLSTSTTNSTCGQTDGSATVTVTGGVTPYAYAWSSGGNTTNETGLAQGTYTVTVTDNNGCTQTITVTVNNTAGATASSVVDNNVSCNGGCDGQGTASATGGSTPYTYAWSSGGNTATESGLCAGTYTVTVTDNNGCTSTAQITITEPPVLIATITNSTNVLCNGDNTGDATVNATGGTTAYTYAWSSGGNTTNETGLSAGTYTVTITDNNGCTTTAQVTITEPPAIVLNTTTTNSNCGQADGSASVTVTGGVTPYTYVWSSGGNTTTETGLAAGSYTVTVTDNNGCTQTITANVTDIGGGTATAVTDINVDCNGNCNGQATVSMTGGSTPYTYAWSSGGNTTTETGLCAGTYTITVTDNNGCIDITTVTITEPPVLVVTVTGSNDALCNGSADGDATVSATGGTTGYTYAWSSGGSTTNETGLAAGTYTVTITDNNGCSATTQITIGEPTPVTATTTFNDALCFGQGSGDATVTASGGTSPYTYTWSSGGNSTTESGLTAGIYTVTVTDNNGCTQTAQVTIGEPAQLTMTYITVDALCNGDCNGAATVTVNGGTTPYTYAWSNSQQGSSASNLCAGSYIVTVTDQNGCSITQQVTINEPAAIIANAIAKDVTCPGDCDGLVDVSLLGGATPYTYTWATGESTEDISGLCTGTYNITITDANGCVSTTNAAINTGNPNPTADFTADPEVTTIRDTEIKYWDNSSSDVTQWSWTFYDTDGKTILGGANEQNPIFIFPDQDSGTYCAELIVTTAAGCQDDTTKCIKIEGIWEVFIPNAFTPNGDGINDYFFPQGIGIHNQPFTFLIFDRWGEIIFESHSLDQKWDGIAHARGGTKKVKQDVYVWKLQVNDVVKNQPHQYIGRVTVVR